MRLRVCLDISAALAQSAGIGRYARELALALHSMAETQDLDLSLIHNRQPLGRLPPALATLQRSEIPLSNKIWRAYAFAGLPLPASWTTAARDTALYHGADAVVPRLAQPSLITIHDLTTLLFPGFHTRSNRIYQRLALPIMVRRASAIIVDAENTRRDLVTHLRVDADRIYTIHLGVDHQRFSARPAAEARARVRSAIGIESPYILALGTLEPRKNLLALLNAYALLDKKTPCLVLAGGQGWGDNPLTQTITSLGITERVHFAGFVADELLPDLYGAAEFFVYPSLYEGFGLPVLEAMACGTPVVTSNVSSLPEITGDAAVLVNPRDVRSIADAVDLVWQAPELRLRMREQGLQQAAAFTWQRTALETIAVYRKFAVP